MPRATRHILAIEDGDEDFDLLRRAFASCDVDTPLVQARRATDALFLLKAGGGRDAPYPCLVLLDLNLPDIDGRELLSILRSDESMRFVPVVVLTTSNNPSDIQLC